MWIRPPKIEDEIVSEICKILSRYSRYDAKALQDVYGTVESIDKLIIVMRLANYYHTSLNDVAENITDPLI